MYKWARWTKRRYQMQWAKGNGGPHLPYTYKIPAEAASLAVGLKASFHSNPTITIHVRRNFRRKSKCEHHRPSIIHQKRESVDSDCGLPSDKSGRSRIHGSKDVKRSAWVFHNQWICQHINQGPSLESHIFYKLRQTSGWLEAAFLESQP